MGEEMMTKLSTGFLKVIDRLVNNSEIRKEANALLSAMKINECKEHVVKIYSVSGVIEIKLIAK